MELMLPGGNRRFTLAHIENQRGEGVQAAPGSGHRVRVLVAGMNVQPEQLEFALLMRDLKPSAAIPAVQLGMPAS